MTIPAFAEGLGGRLPSESEKAAANQLRRILATQATGDAKLRVLDEATRQPAEIILSPALSNLLMELLRHVGPLAGTLKRNLLLTFAEAEFFRLRWSLLFLDETEHAIETILQGKHVIDAAARARRARVAMETAFEGACVTDVDDFIPACVNLPDPSDHHVLAAALKTQY